MRILFLHDRIRTGGSERNTIDLMVALERLGADTLLCLLGGDSTGPLAQKLARSRLNAVFLGGKGLGDIRAVTRFVRLLCRERFDLVHLQDPYPALLAAVARYAFLIPVFTTVHVQPTLAKTRRGRLRDRILKSAIRAASDRLLVLAEALKQPAEHHFRIPPDRVLVIPNGIEPWADMTGRRAELRRRLGWTAEDRIILMAAVLRPGKGHADLFSALPRIQALHPKARIKIAGEGELREELMALAAPLGDAVEFLGERSDIPELMTAADVLVLPSESEAYPTVLLEAAMAGLPAVASAVGGCGEIIDHGSTGLLAPPRAPHELAAAVSAILSDGEMALSLGEAARRKGRTAFTVMQQAERTLAAYSAFLARSIPDARAGVLRRRAG